MRQKRLPLFWRVRASCRARALQGPLRWSNTFVHFDRVGDFARPLAMSVRAKRMSHPKALNPKQGRSFAHLKYPVHVEDENSDCHVVLSLLPRLLAAVVVAMAPNDCFKINARCMQLYPMDQNHGPHMGAMGCQFIVSRKRPFPRCLSGVKSMLTTNLQFPLSVTRQ